MKNKVKLLRWEQRFLNYLQALEKLKQAVAYIQNHQLNNASESIFQSDSTLDEILKEGLIQRFEYTHELAWNVMKDYAIYQGNSEISGSRDATREAFRLQLISNGQLWMEMLESRNKTSHTYHRDTAEEIYDKILSLYYFAFLEFEENMKNKMK